MTTPIDVELQTAVRDAKQIAQSSPREAPRLLQTLIAEHFREGRISCALEVRSIQCFALIGNLDYEWAESAIDTLLDEAVETNHLRYLGIAEMYRGILWMAQGRCNLAVEHYDRAIQVGIELGDLDLIYRVQINLAFAQSMLERYEDALDTLLHSVRYTESSTCSTGDATKLYNVAAARIQLAYQFHDRGTATTAMLDEARHAILAAKEWCKDDPYLSLLLEVYRALLAGLEEGFAVGIQQLRELRPQIEASAPVHFITYSIAESRILESAEEWEDLSRLSDDLIERMRRTHWLAAIQTVLRRAAKAHAKIGNFERAYGLMQEWLMVESREPGDQRAEVASLRLDLQKHKFDQEVLRMRNTTLVERNKILEHEARFDPLSGILNRRGTEEALREFCDRLHTDRFGIALIDIDHFKRINDRFGHAVGDRVIREFAACLVKSETKPAKLGRWGGEEFLVVFDLDDPAGMADFGKTLVDEIRRYPWGNLQRDLSVTASCGLSLWTRGMSLDDSIRMADDMMYDVKHHGRNDWRVAA